MISAEIKDNRAPKSGTIICARPPGTFTSLPAAFVWGQLYFYYIMPHAYEIASATKKAALSQDTVSLNM